MTLIDTNTTSQCREILAYLKTGKGITNIEALKMFGTFRLSGRIWDLKNLENDIVPIWETAKNTRGKTVRFVRYYLKEFAPPIQAEKVTAH